MDAKVEPADISKALSQAARAVPGKKPTALVVVHGMGQQVPFSALDEVVHCIGEGIQRHGIIEPTQTIEHLRINDSNDPADQIPRIVLTFQWDQESSTTIHVYEAYWAPLTEGLASAADAIRLLYSGGILGLKTALFSGRFERQAFGRTQSYPVRKDAVTLAVALLVISALIIISGAFLPVFVGDLLRLPAAALAACRSALASFMWLCLVFGVLCAIGVKAHVDFYNTQAVRATGNAIIYVSVTSILAGAVVCAGAILIAAGGVIGHVFAVTTVGEALTWVGSRPTKSLWAVAGIGFVVSLLCAWARRRIQPASMGDEDLPPGHAIRRWMLSLTFNTALVTILIPVAAMAVKSLSALHPATTRLLEWAHFPKLATFWLWSPEKYYLLFLLFGGGLTYGLHVFFVQYIGDVAIYVSAHSVNRFWTARDRIQRAVFDLFLSVYSQDYEQIVIASHSLGSVAAYDALNRVIRADLELGAVPSAASRTAAFLTCGSPLDKIAFMFRSQRVNKREDARSPSGATGLSTCLTGEDVAAARQPLITKYDDRHRPRSWVNVYSRLDWISGPLDYFDKDPRPEQLKAEPPDKVTSSFRVQNLRDPHGTTPLLNHTRYWRHHVMQDLLLASLLASKDEDLLRAAVSYWRAES